MFEWHEIDTARDAGRRAAEGALPDLVPILARADTGAAAQGSVANVLEETEFKL
jgi:hypothetical protein